MKIREARHSDAAACAGVHVGSWKTTYAGIVSREFLDGLSVEKRTSDWRCMLSDSADQCFFYVCEDDNVGLVGFAGGGPERGGNKTYTGELGAIYLLEPFQRQGIGPRLVAAVAGRLIRQGHASMLVWVLAENPFRAFYEALGGVLLGEQKKVTLGGTDMVEVAYGWKDITGLAAASGRE